MEHLLIHNKDKKKTQHAFWLEMQNCSLPQDATEITVVLFCACTLDNVLMYACSVWKGSRAKGMLQTGVCLCEYVRLPDVTAEDASCSLIQYWVCVHT